MNLFCCFLKQTGSRLLNATTNLDETYQADNDTQKNPI